MSVEGKTSNTAQDIKGKIKEKVGDAIGNKNLEEEGKADQAESAVKDLGDKIKEAATKIKHAVSDD